MSGFLASSGGTGAALQQQRQGLQTGLRGSDIEALPTMESSYTLPDQGGLCGATQAPQVSKHANARQGRRSTRLAMHGREPAAAETRAAVGSGFKSTAGFPEVAQLGGTSPAELICWRSWSVQKLDGML